VGSGEHWSPKFWKRGVRTVVRSTKNAWCKGPLCNEVGKDLTLDGMAGLEVELKSSELRSHLAMLPVALELWRMALNG
jgi:hypothetical protein